jgi:hypothetical protein
MLINQDLRFFVPISSIRLSPIMSDIKVEGYKVSGFVQLLRSLTYFSTPDI